MHELSLCQSAVEIIQRQAEQHDVKRVTAVWLEIGALSCVEESAVRFSFEIVCHGINVAELEGTPVPINEWLNVIYVFTHFVVVFVSAHAEQATIKVYLLLQVKNGGDRQL